MKTHLRGFAAAALLVASLPSALYTNSPEALQMTSEEFGRFIAAETAKWAKVVKEAGIKPE